MFILSWIRSMVLCVSVLWWRIYRWVTAQPSTRKIGQGPYRESRVLIPVQVSPSSARRRRKTICALCGVGVAIALPRFCATPSAPPEPFVDATVQVPELRMSPVLEPLYPVRRPVRRVVVWRCVDRFPSR